MTTEYRTFCPISWCTFTATESTKTLAQEAELAHWNEEHAGIPHVVSGKVQ